MGNERREKRGIRERIFEIIEVAQEGDRLSDLYDSFMLLAIIISIIPLAFKQSYQFFEVTDLITVVIFIIDYILRWLTADYKLQIKAVISFASQRMEMLLL